MRAEISREIPGRERWIELGNAAGGAGKVISHGIGGLELIGDGRGTTQEDYDIENLDAGLKFLDSVLEGAWTLPSQNKSKRNPTFKGEPIQAFLYTGLRLQFLVYSSST